jgi:hypothetical protein
MSHLKMLLQEADPLRHEPPFPDEKRERIRRAVLDAPMVTPATTQIGTRLPILAVAVAVLISVVAVGYGLWEHGTTALLAAVRFEVRLAENQPAPGLVVAGVPGSSQLIYLHPEIVVSNDDIAQSWVSQDGQDQFSVVVDLLPSGAERMRQATADHLGRPVALLIDGSVVMAPTVRAPIGSSAVITGHFTRAEADRITNGIGRR